MKWVSRGTAAAAMIALLAACSGTRFGGQRETAAPSFDVISEAQLHSTMGQFAQGVRKLQNVLGSEGAVDRQQQARVIEILDQMIAAADALGPDAVSVGHPQVGHDLPRFREKLAIARRSAGMTPPRYYLVGNLSGTCFACHGGD